MQTSEFNQLKQAVNGLAPKQKADLEQHLLNPQTQTQPQVLKLLAQSVHGWTSLPT